MIDRSSAPGVVVLGMHRSGTSVVTALLHRAGLAFGRDPRFDRGGPANPRGFWEIQALTRTNEGLLRALDGEWSAPPDLANGWPTDPRLMPLRPGAERIFRRSMPARAWVWKDPRLCLTTPFWQALGVQTSAAIVVVRHPSEVLASLAARDGLEPRLSAALWERYLHGAVASARGLPTVIVSYGTVLADPVGWTAATRDRLAGIGMTLGDLAPDGVVASTVDVRLRHTHRGSADLRSDPLVSPEQGALFDVLLDAERSGTVDELQLPPVTPGAAELLDERRRQRAETRRRKARWDRRVRRAAVRSLVDVKDHVRSSTLSREET
jgi:hypothetical protein